MRVCWWGVDRPWCCLSVYGGKEEKKEDKSEFLSWSLPLSL